MNVPYVRSKSRYLQGLSRFNRAPTDLTQSSPNRQTPFWTPISQPASFSTPRRRGSSPLVCVPKKSGGIRITVNYQKLNKITEIPQIAIPRVDEVLDTLGGGPVFSIFHLFSGFTRSTIYPDTIPLIAFCTPNGLCEWLRMPQGAASAPAWFVSVMRLVTADLDNIRMYLDDAIGSDDYPIHHVATLATFFARLRLHKLKLSPDKSRIGSARVDFLGHIISADGVRLSDDRVAALTRMPMPADTKQLRSLLGGLTTTSSCPTWLAKSAR